MRYISIHPENFDELTEITEMSEDELMAIYEASTNRDQVTFYVVDDSMVKDISTHLSVWAFPDHLAPAAGTTVTIPNESLRAEMLKEEERTLKELVRQWSNYAHVLEVPAAHKIRCFYCGGPKPRQFVACVKCGNMPIYNLEKLTSFS